jgi:hypothetical protein
MRTASLRDIFSAMRSLPAVVVGADDAVRLFACSGRNVCEEWLPRGVLCTANNGCALVNYEARSERQAPRTLTVVRAMEKRSVSGCAL